MNISTVSLNDASNGAIMETEASKPPMTFLSLPAELRNEIYHLSGCLEVKQFAHMVTSPRCMLHKLWGDTNVCNCWTCEQDGRRCNFYRRAMRFYRGGLSASLIWVNRNSNFATKGHRANVGKGSLRMTRVSHGWSWGGSSAVDHAAHIRDGVEQPAITKVSKEVGADTLPMFYGSHRSMFTLFNIEIDAASVCKWMRTIGKGNVAILREAVVVVRSKAGFKFAHNQLKLSLKKLGLRTDQGAVMRVVKLEHPFCYCESCVRQAVRMDGMEMEELEELEGLGDEREDW